MCHVDPTGKPCSTSFIRLHYDGNTSLVKCKNSSILEMAQYNYCITMESLTKDTLNTGHLHYKGHFSCPILILYYVKWPINKGHLYQKDKFAGPNGVRYREDPLYHMCWLCRMSTFVNNLVLNFELLDSHSCVLTILYFVLFIIIVMSRFTKNRQNASNQSPFTMVRYVNLFLLLYYCIIIIDYIDKVILLLMIHYTIILHGVQKEVVMDKVSSQ